MWDVRSCVSCEYPVCVLLLCNRVFIVFLCVFSCVFHMCFWVVFNVCMYVCIYMYLVNVDVCMCVFMCYCVLIIHDVCEIAATLQQGILLCFYMYFYVCIEMYVCVRFFSRMSGFLLFSIFLSIFRYSPFIYMHFWFTLILISMYIYRWSEISWTYGVPKAKIWYCFDSLFTGIMV